MALIVVDMQARYEDMSRRMNTIDKVVSVIKACHEARVPVFFTQHHSDPTQQESVLNRWWKRPMIRGTDEWQLIKEIEQVSDRNTDTFIHDTTYDGFYDTELKTKLLEQGVDTVAVCGAMTNLCCETTARSAFVHNFNVIFLSDGNATTTQEFQDATILNLEFGFATIKTCQEFTTILK